MLFVDLSLRPPEVSHPLSSINFVTHGLCHAGGNTYIKAWRSAIPEANEQIAKEYQILPT